MSVNVSVAVGVKVKSNPAWAVLKAQARVLVGEYECDGVNVVGGWCQCL